jgi:hypothetical protein
MLDIGRDSYFALTRKTLGTFKSEMNRGTAALAFGTKRALAGGKYLDVDVFAHDLRGEIAKSFSLKAAATIVCSFDDQWLEGVSRADRERDPIFFVIMESGDKLSEPLKEFTGAEREGIVATAGTLEELGKILRGPKKTIPERLICINMKSILQGIRRKAAALGIDLSAPFCPDTDDPGFKKLCREIRESRERDVERVSP